MTETSQTSQTSTSQTSDNTINTIVFRGKKVTTSCTVTMCMVDTIFCEGGEVNVDTGIMKIKSPTFSATIEKEEEKEVAIGIKAKRIEIENTNGPVIIYLSDDDTVRVEKSPGIDLIQFYKETISVTGKKQKNPQNIIVTGSRNVVATNGSVASVSITCHDGQGEKVTYQKTSEAPPSEEHPPIKIFAPKWCEIISDKAVKDMRTTDK